METRTMDTRSRPVHPIRIVSSRTGVSPSLLRAWERRYEAVSPGRSDTGQRLYSENDVHRVALLARLVEVGHAIGSVAGLSTVDLEELVGDGPGFREAVGGRPPGVGEILRKALEAARAMDGQQLDRIFLRAALMLRPEELIDDVLVVLLRELGDAWESGSMSPAVEHAATVSVRRFLEWLRGAMEGDVDAPRFVAGTPPGQMHEFGALLAAVTAATEGWRSSFLGPDLPAAELADAARRTSALAVAVSAIHPPLDAAGVEEVLTLRRLLPRHVDLIAGGPALASARGALEAANIRWYGDLGALRTGLRTLFTQRYGQWVG